MKTYLYVMAGGALGAILRFGVGSKDIYIISEKFPSETFLANVLGTFFLAFFLRWAFETKSFSKDFHSGVAPGLLGAFTTFSTMCKESSQLLLQGQISLFLAYILASVFIGLAFAWLGFEFSGWSRLKFTKKDAGGE